MASSSSSFIIASIDASLHHLATLRNLIDFKTLEIGLKNLKVFLLCLTKFCSHAPPLRSSRLGSLLLRIEDAIGRIPKEAYTSVDHVEFARKMENARSIIAVNAPEIYCLQKELDGEYICILNLHREKSSSSLTASDVVEITDSILDGQMEFLRRRLFSIRKTMRELDVLEVQITFLKNFLVFAMRSSTVQPRCTQLQKLLIHFEAVAVDAARLFVNFGVHKEDEILPEEMRLKCSILVQKIVPLDPQVCQAYLQALSCSKLYSRRLLAPTEDIILDDDTIMITLKNFLDSLISVLWYLLQLDACHLVCMKDRLQVLYDGLRFSRAILKQRPENFDEKIRNQIGFLICDIGMFICLFHQASEEIYRRLPDLLERINVIRGEVEKRAKVEKKVSQRSVFNIPITNELGFVDSIVESLMELKNCNAEPIAAIVPQTMPDELAFLRSFLGKIAELRNEQEELQTLWTRVLEVAYRVELLIDHLVAGDISSSFSNLSDSIMEDIRTVKTDVLKIFYSDRKDIKVPKAIGASSHQTPRSSPSMTSEVVGFHDDAISIIDRLTRGSKERGIVVISGMAGSGKTTLALKVYNDPSVMLHFQARAWWPISQVLDKKKVLFELLNQIDHGMCSEMTEEQDLAEKLRRSLKGKRYLIFLDDVWTTEVWQSLVGSFPKDSTQSRIILTSRNCNVAPEAMRNEKPHLLDPLSDDESLDLLQMRLFSGKGWPPTLKRLGMQIVENCKGLPLTIVIVAGLLATIEQEGWEKILDALGSGVVSSTDQCMNTLELSYKQLPDYLKPCLLYFGAFPEDQEVSVRMLIRLWIAEGFVEKTNSKRKEDVAEEYVAGLIDRNLLMVAKQKSTCTGAKACRIHDLLRDFCLRKAEQENFFHLLQGQDQLLDLHESCYLRRLCIHSKPAHFVESKLFCPRARSLLFFSTQQFDFFNEYWFDISFIIHMFKLLKVLRVDEIRLSEGLPTEIGALVQLRYLSIRGNLTVIPSSIGKLSNLETLSVVIMTRSRVPFPNTFWNLQKLKYLHIENGILPVENLESSSVLFELETLSNVIIDSDESMEKQMMKFPNLRRLRCILVNGGKKVDRIVVPNFLSRLESLSMNGNGWYDPIRKFGLPVSLRKVTLAWLRLSRREISIIGRLPNLEVLKLDFTPISNDTLEMEEGEFSKLIFLKLSGLNIVKWTAFDEDQLPNLQKLELSNCPFLKEIPSCLERVPTLEVIDVSSCSRAIESSLKHIEEVQMDLGNSNIKIQSIFVDDYDSPRSHTDD